ncbi:MAG: HD domain-containing protein [Bacteroidetes bacterium]|nr:MAG: HD domain-containing protein [Bacteroidota bacterium]
MKNKKIFNDPVYGFVEIPQGIVFELIEHPWFQRLRRIKQLSLTDYVYPGALHTRFHHALGALHLMGQAIEVLRGKGVDISDEEASAVCIAILLHDIGHGPFSHTLEHTLMETTHEEISVLFMEAFNRQFDGALDLAIRIFKNDYDKKFLSQLISGQLDMDRMDYLNRDSFFTGVYEGVIGYDRIIKMLSVHNGELVVEEKGIYSIEKFLIARRLMYWQVYLHKTVLSSEQMLIGTMGRARYLVKQGKDVPAPDSLKFFLENKIRKEDFDSSPDELLNHFARLDDHDIVSAMKQWKYCDDKILSFLSTGIIDRKLFRLEFSDEPFDEKYIKNKKEEILAKTSLNSEDLEYVFYEGTETNSAYSTVKDEIKILFKSGKTLPMSSIAQHGIQTGAFTKYYICYPKNL